MTLLLLAQIAYNQLPTTTTSTSLFFTNYGFELDDYTGQIEVSADNLTAALTAREFCEMQESLRLDLMFCRTRMTMYANCKRLKGPTLKGGDKVYLLRRNIRSDKPTKKLDAVKLGLFKILKKKGPVNYELELPKKMRIYLVFYVSLLKPATPDATL
jgi:hypothetical protein